MTIFDGKVKKELVVREADIRVNGQTSGEWISLGKFQLKQGEKAYVEISNKNADGIVVADAILFVPDKK